MKKFFKLLLIIIFALLIFYQLKTFATKQSQTYDKYVSYVDTIQKITTEQETQALEIEIKLSNMLEEKDAAILTNKLTSLYTAIIEDPKSTKKEKLKSKESLAELKLKNGEIQQAYNLALEVLQQQPKSHISSGILSVIARDRANEYLKQSQYDQAISEYQNLLRLPLSENYQALTESKIAHLYRNSGDYETALTLYQNLKQNHPHLPNWASFAQHEIVDIYYAKNDIPKAKEELTKLLTQHPHTDWSNAGSAKIKEFLP